MSHPLDRAVWGALTTRQAHLAQGDARALRLDAAYGAFAAAADATPENVAGLSDLARATGLLVLFEAGPPSEIAGCTVTLGDPISQMVMGAPALIAADLEFLDLGLADASEMLALATLTEPGPFFARTGELGDFVGVRVRGELVAMAGERLKLPGYTEVSAVCTHPDHRGRGYAAALTSVVSRRILARGETPFLHAYDRNAGAIAVYERLGFVRRRQVKVSFVQPL